MITNIKYQKAKRIIDNISRLDHDKKNISQALSSPVLSCTIDYGSGAYVPIYNVDLMLKLLNTQLELIEEELVKYYNELEEL